MFNKESLVGDGGVLHMLSRGLMSGGVKRKGDGFVRNLLLKLLRRTAAFIKSHSSGRHDTCLHHVK